ncbi:MAG: hypothetical protein ABIR62_10960 [Dokdonella sp.]|uniref:hypothetical protein n=1 Tax=Dokdonella sp. TaxID=2291710 RepID=UPI003265AA2A
MNENKAGPSFQLTLDPALATATVQVDAKLDAHGVEDLVAELARMRARMTPAVASRPPSTERSSERTKRHGACHFAVQVDDAGECRFWIRHAGVGWIACTLPLAATLPLADLFRRVTSNCANEPAFFVFDPAVAFDDTAM